MGRSSSKVHYKANPKRELTSRGQSTQTQNQGGFKVRLCFISSVQSFSRVLLFVTPWTAARQASLSISNSWSLLRLMFIELVMPSKRLIPVIPFSCLQSRPASGSFLMSQLFTSGGQSWSFSFSISSSNEY